MKNLRQPLRFDKGIGRFEEEVSFATEGVYTYAESSANGVAKRPESVKKQLITVFPRR